MSTSSIPLYWRLQKPKYTLTGSKCSGCGGVFFPPRIMCPVCRRKGKLEELRLAGKGTIQSWTVIRTAPEGFERAAPYAIALIRLDEGPVIAGQIVDCELDSLAIGQRVTAVFRKIREDGPDGILHYGLKWKPDEK